MDNILFFPVAGIIQSIRPFSMGCCDQIAAIRTENGIVNVIVTAETYVSGERMLRRGMSVVAFYDGNAPVPLIFPPQYRAIAVAIPRSGESVMVDYFDDSLTGSNNSLRLNVGTQTKIRTPNGQRFHCDLPNRVLMVFYSSTTRSIPPQTTPREIIAMC